MPYSLEKLQDFWGSGSLPIEDKFGTTLSDGVYSSTGIDTTTLPGIILMNPAYGVFKKGPSDLFTSGSRTAWWGAKVDNENTASISIYKVIANSYSVLSHTTPPLSVFPRSFDFDLYADGHIIVIAEHNEQLYGYYSFDSGSGWQLITNGAPALTPKILFLDDTCMVAFASYSTPEEIDYPRSTNVQYANEIKYTFISSLVSCSGFETYTIPTINTTNITHGWTNRGHLSGTMSGYFDGSMFGTFSGSFGSAYGNRVFARPAAYYGQNTGDLTGSFSGYFSGYFSGTLPSIINVGGGIFSGSISGTVDGVPHTNESGEWSGTIIGMLDGWAYPDEQLLVQNLSFLSDIVELSNGRIQLTYGIYNVMNQSATYQSLTSGIRLTNSVVNPGGGYYDTYGAPCSFEILRPQELTTSPSLDVLDMRVDDPFIGDGLLTYTATFLKSYATSTYLSLDLRGWTGTGILVYALWDDALTFYYKLNVSSGPLTIKKVMVSTGASEWLNWPQTTPVTITPHTQNQPEYYRGIIFPSGSMSDAVFQGTHFLLGRTVATSVITGRRLLSSYGTVSPSGSWTGSSEVYGTSDGISPANHLVTFGSRGRIHTNDSSAPLNVRGTMLLGNATMSVTSYANVTDTQILNFTYNSMSWNAGSGPFVPSYDSQWYPQATLVLTISGSALHPIHQSIVCDNVQVHILKVSNIP